MDVAAGIFYNRFTVGDLIKFRGLSIGAQASKGFGPANLYGGLAWESSTMNLKYQTNDPIAQDAKIDIDLKGDNNFRLTLGGGLSLGFFKLFADVNLGPVTNFSGGLGFGL